MTTDQFDVLNLIVAIFALLLSGFSIWYTRRRFKISHYPRLQIDIDLEPIRILEPPSQQEKWYSESLLFVKLWSLRPDVTVSDITLSLYIAHPKRSLRFWRKRWLLFTVIHKAEPMSSNKATWNLTWDNRPPIVENIGSYTLEDFLAKNLPTALKSRPLDLKVALSYQPGLFNVKPISITKYYTLFTSHTPQEGPSPDEDRLFVQKLEPK